MMNECHDLDLDLNCKKKFRSQIASFVRRSDPTRPVTLVINKSSVQDVAVSSR